MKKSLLIALLGIGLLGCLGMKNVPVRPFLDQVEQGFTEEETVHLRLQELSAEESQKYLHKDVLEWGIQPVQVTITNTSADPYLFAPEKIGLPLVDAKSIASKILKEAIPRSIGFKIASLIFWPLAIPSTIDTIMTLKSHASVKRGLSSKAIREEIIPPYSTVNRIFFVKREDYKGPFTLSLENQETLITQVFEAQTAQSGAQHLTALPVIQENYYLTHG